MKLAALTLLPLMMLTAADDPRLTIHTLVREDIFAGFLANDLERLAKGEAKAQELLAARPAQKQQAQLWLAGATIFRAALAREKGDLEKYRELYKQGMAFAEEGWKTPDSGVLAVTGGVAVVVADRLADPDKALWWDKAYGAFQKMATQQMPGLAQFPLHFKGELLAGLAMSAHRTGHSEELPKLLALMEQHLAATPYEALVKKWRENPEIAAKTNLGCKSCHEPGRLEPTRARLTAAR